MRSWLTSLIDKNTDSNNTVIVTEKLIWITKPIYRVVIKHISRFGVDHVKAILHGKKDQRENELCSAQKDTSFLWVIGDLLKMKASSLAGIIYHSNI